ncbi:MAG: hypothetical protein ACREBS_07990 [Nitrososphaerales archaeon]
MPSSRILEIRRYLYLFGYKPERSILQVYIAGYFGRRVRNPRETGARERSAARYGGRTFTVLGRTHDPSFLARLIPPKRRQEESSSGYLGYFFKGKAADGKTTDELLALDFVPANLPYPTDWKDMFGTKGYLITMHIPSDFARQKNELIARLRRIRGAVDVKKEWKFLDELEGYGYGAVNSDSLHVKQKRHGKTVAGVTRGLYSGRPLRQE